MDISGGKLLDKAAKKAQNYYSRHSLSGSKNLSGLGSHLGLNLDNIEQEIHSLRNEGWLLCETANLGPYLDSFLNNAIDQLKEENGVNLLGLDPKKSNKTFDKEIIGLSEEWILKQELTQLFLQDEIVHRIVAGYLGVDPVLTQTISWFSMPSEASARSQSAQRWHYDCDYVRWIKVFLYVTDVTNSNGAHEFVPKSHAK